MSARPGPAGTGRSCRRTRLPPRRTGPGPSGPLRAAHRSPTSAAARRRTPRDRRRRPRGCARASPRWCSSRASRQPPRASARQPRRRPPAATAPAGCAPTGGGQLRVVGVDRRQGLRDGQPVRPLGTGHVRGVMGPGKRDPGRLEGRRVLRRPTGIAAARDTTGALGEEGRGACPGPRGTDHVDPLPGHDRPGGPCPGEAGPDGRGVARHEPSRSSSSSSAAAALSRLFAERSPDHRWRRTSAPA